MTTTTTPETSAEPAPALEPHSRWWRYAPPALLAILGVVLGARLWGRVGDLLIDFGREIYIPAQLAQGRVLYRDMAYMYGPLPPYVNAAWWLLFGGTERAIIYGNVIVLLIVCVLMYRLFVLAADRYAATIAMALFLACGAFIANTRITNYNFLTPYAHGTTHGLALCLGAAKSLIALHRTRRVRYALLAGALVGLSFLTKPEILFAACATTGSGLLVILLGERDNRQRVRVALAFAGAAIIPPLAALGLLAAAMPFDVALDGWLNSWRYVGTATASPYFLTDMGRDTPWTNGWKAVRYACLYGQFLIGLFLAAVVLRRWLCAWPRVSAVLAVIVGVALFALTQHYPYRPRFWLDIGRGLPIFPLVGLLVGLIAVRRPRDATPRALAILMVSALAGALIVKLWLNARLYNYGFVLATPAVAVGALLATGWLPNLVRRVGGYAPLIRFGATGLAIGVIVWQQHLTSGILDERTVAVATPGGWFKLTPKQSTIAEAVTAMKAIASPGQTLAVVPDGAGINYATGMFNPATYDILNPLVLELIGERRITQAYAAHPPDFILLVHHDTAQYGARWFGRDYARDMAALLASRYEPVGRFGEPDDGRLPIDLFRRRAKPTSTTGPAMQPVHGATSRVSE
jgi:4-amino-4-deoxy-L-arabinose transferase-like glycosyltransferase